MNKATDSSLTSRESLFGFLYLAFQFVFLPELLFRGNGNLPRPLSDGQLNFVFYTINFLAMLVIFHRFLRCNLTNALHHPGCFCRTVLLGLAAYFLCRYGMTRLTALLAPAFANQNDAAIAAMGQENRALMLVGTALLVPPYEECVYRGLIFRNLWEKSPWAGYLVSTFVFSGIHILGYMGQYSSTELLIAMVQYLPAGLLLAWAYQKTDTIFAPITIHAIVNFCTLTAMR